MIRMLYIFLPLFLILSVEGEPGAPTSKRFRLGDPPPRVEKKAPAPVTQFKGGVSVSPSQSPAVWGESKAISPVKYIPPTSSFSGGDGTLVETGLEMVRVGLTAIEERDFGKYNPKTGRTTFKTLKGCAKSHEGLNRQYNSLTNFHHDLENVSKGNFFHGMGMSGGGLFKTKNDCENSHKKLSDRLNDKRKEYDKLREQMTNLVVYHKGLARAFDREYRKCHPEASKEYGDRLIKPDVFGANKPFPPGLKLVGEPIPPEPILPSRSYSSGRR